MTELFQYLNQFHKIDAATFEMLSTEFNYKAFKKSEFIIREHEVQKELLFVTKGTQMSFFEGQNKIHVVAFTYAPGLCAIPDSFMFQTPSKYALQCLSDSEFYSLSYSRLQKLLDASHSLERLFRRMAEAVLAGVISRHIDLHSLSIEERFRNFSKRSPHLFQMVPHKYIASYLDIDPTNFSKLYNSVKI
jgi:CRP-like cAMP-binding protein